MAFTDSADNAPPDDAAGASAAGGGAGGGPAGGGPPPPPGGGPILAALARNQMQPPVSMPGPGNMAQGLMMLKQAVDMIHSALPNLEPGSKPYTDATKALTAISRHLPQGAPTAGVQATQLGDMLRKTQQNALLQRLMAQRQQGQGGQGGGGQQPPQGGGGGMPAGPAPSMPLPGA